MSTAEDLRATLYRIDGRGYKAYKSIQGYYTFERHTLFIDYAQGDPFAAPSRIRIRVSLETSRIPDDLYANKVRRIALQDYLARSIRSSIENLDTRSRGSGKSGLIHIDAGQQAVIERTALLIQDDWVEARLEVGLPARGRSVLGRQAIELLSSNLTELTENSLIWKAEPNGVRHFVNCIENQEHLRTQLETHKLIAFIGNGSILPRHSGVDDRPLATKQAIAFTSPPSLELSLELLHPIASAQGMTQSIKGMGIPQGVSLIVGGGFHGKSTVLQSIEKAVYNHIPGDGREYIVTRQQAAKIRAEDGRRIEKVNITPFISNLPLGQDTEQFSTENASGSTSQAASIVEAIEVGSDLLLLDEDTSATNFMVRDARMQALVHKEDEPITPFLDRVRLLYEQHYISTLLVVGGSGDYFDVADTVILMKEYLPYDVTQEATNIAQQNPTHRVIEQANNDSPFTPAARKLIPHSLDASKGKHSIKIEAKSKDTLHFGMLNSELRAVEQIIESSQTRAIGHALIKLRQLAETHPKQSLKDLFQALVIHLETNGLAYLSLQHGECHPGNLAMPRTHEIAAALNRLSGLKLNLPD